MLELPLLVLVVADITSLVQG